jgi:hypothetical protein
VDPEATARAPAATMAVTVRAVTTPVAVTPAAPARPAVTPSRTDAASAPVMRSR